ncbi:Nucleotide-binding universal stress protein, UspA family [Chitinophaga sp. CF118]|uniref:universal stress protein n=1 Tax=Chitinophaga sp. CF118 TaxID=1884367 RepID=UPI0008E886E0|nr:universal stress protein [Chitinophaga sp. CF118]SFF06421.1 Nucleotide-binding universal stress protein, UspA family [Chitinophaga sp. CF118]
MIQILVLTDFSTCANNAVNFAVQSAKILPAELTIMHAFEMKSNMYIDYMGVNKEFTQSLVHEEQTKLDQLKQSIEGTEGIVVNTQIIKASLNEAVLQVTDERGINLVVVGTLGVSGIKQKLWGSRTADLLGKSKVPVMVIPYDYEWKKPETFLFATNHLEKEPAILNTLFELADLYMSQVQVALFTDDNEDIAITFLEYNRGIPEYEKMLKEQYNEDTLTTAHLYGTEFGETLEKHIKETEVDVLAMVIHHRSFLERIFHPSHTKRMSYHTEIPLLAIPAK